MKKRIIRIWGIGLIVALLASMLFMPTTASASDPLIWYTEVIPSTTGKVLQPSLDILDMSVNPDGEVIYAAGWVRGYEPGTAIITTQLAAGDGDPETYIVSYTNQDGTAGRLGSLSFSDNATVDTTAAVVLATGDSGIKSIQDVYQDVSDAATGAFDIISDTTSVDFGAYDQATDAWTADSAVTDTTKKLYKSINGGETWTDLSDATGLDITNTQFVACAPDDTDLLIVVDGTSDAASAYVSEDGGIEFGGVSLPITGTTTNVDTVYDVDLSAAVGGVHYAALCGIDQAGNGGVWYYKLGIGGAWTAAHQLEGFNTSATTGYGSTNEAWALAFSPNFASDQVLTVATDNGTTVFFEMLGVSTTAAASAWNEAAGFDNYPVAMADKDGAVLDTVTDASVALAPTYLGGDEVERIAFVGISGSVAERGVYRLQDYVDKHIMADEQQIYSVAYDGTTVVAGENVGTNCIVWRCSDPLTTIPTFYPTTTTKAPSGAMNPILAWRGTSVVAATAGSESAFSVSEDDGKSFNGISLIDTSIATIDDMAVSADVGRVYLVTDDGIDTSVWRRASDFVRVLSIPSDTNYIVRTAPDDPDVVYVAEKSGKDVYYGKEGGDDKWYSRRSAHNIQDMAVESQDVAYIAKASSDAVIKTTNSGFTWGAAEDTELAGGNIFSIKSLSEDNLIVGSTEGYVSYSTDGNDSWTKIDKAISTTAGNTVVTAAGLAEGDLIIAGSSEAGSSLYRWKVGQSQSVPWKDILAQTAAGYSPTNTINSVVLTSGVLYAGTDQGVIYRTLSSGVPDSMVNPVILAWSSTTAGTSMTTMDISATAQYVASDTTLTVWAASAGNLKSFQDVLALPAAAPVQIAPDDATVVKMNPISGGVYVVPVTWGHIAFASSYDVFLAYDPGFLQSVWGPPQSAGSVGLPTMTYNIDGSYLTPGTTYYWRVRTGSAGPLTSPFSTTRSFTVEATPAIAPQIGSPVNGGTVTSVNPAFSWSPVAGAKMYEFQLAVGTNFGAALHAEKLADTGIRPAVKLDPGMTYFWRVRVVEPQVGDWSSIANFTVAEPEEAPPPPVVVEQVPPPQINIPAAPPAQVIQLPEAPAPPAQIAPGYIWAIIIIGAVLVIAVIVLIVRTRRSV